VATASLWWIYFDSAEELDVGRGPWARNALIYGHLPVDVGLTAVGVGVKEAILGAAEGAPPGAAGWALGAARPSSSSH